MQLGARSYNLQGHVQHFLTLRLGRGSLGGIRTQRTKQRRVLVCAIMQDGPCVEYGIFCYQCFHLQVMCCDDVVFHVVFQHMTPGLMFSCVPH